MLKLYIREGCPYCLTVVHKLEEMDIPYQEENIAHAEKAKELISRGGKQQVPYLVDQERGVAMYESTDIVQYLERTFGGGKQG